MRTNLFKKDLRQKAEIFNSFFANPCTPIDNSSKLPLELEKKTQNALSPVNFTENDTEKIIKFFDPNKAHEHNSISIRMLKICSNSICKFFNIIYSFCIKSGKFHYGKKANVVPIPKKGEKPNQTRSR